MSIIDQFKSLATLPVGKVYVPCKRCEEFDEVHDQNCPDHPDHDPTPWCGYCGARKRLQCKCGPMAENE